VDPVGGGAARGCRGPEFDDVRALGSRAVKALGLETGFTHMEWFRRDDGSLAIGEIAARPPGAHIVLANSYAHDADLYRAWARAVVDGAFDGPWERATPSAWPTCAASAAAGCRRCAASTSERRRWGAWWSSRGCRRWVRRAVDSYEGDGYVVVRDPDTEVVKAAMATIIETIQIEYA
jgi:biotin carboxylase